MNDVMDFNGLIIRSWSFLRARFSIYKIIVFGFLIVMIFIDDNNLIRRYQYDTKINKLEKEIEHYQKVIEESRHRLNELRSNEENLEKFAREQFLMKKENEDIFVIE